MLDLECHHIGIATKNLEQEIKQYQKLGYKVEGEIFEDAIQKIRGVFMLNNNIRIELLEGIAKDSPTVSYLKKGIAMYHQGYLVDDIHKMISQLVKDGAILVVEPVNAIAFEGRQIAFLFMRNRMLIELIERED